MSILVHIPIAWRKHVNEKVTVELEEGLAVTLLQDLEFHYPELRGQLLENGDVNPALNVIVNGTDIRVLNGLKTFIEAGSDMKLILEHRKG